MLMKKTESENDRDDRHHQREESRDEGAEDEDEDDERGRQPDLELTRLEVVLRELVEVLVERPLAGHRDGEAVAAVRLLDGRHERIDVRLALHPDQQRVTVARDLQRKGARDDPRGLALSAEPPHERPERRVFHGVRLRADDDQLVHRPRVRREPLAEEVLGLLRLRIPGHVSGGRQVPWQEQDREGERDDDCPEPGAERAPRMAARPPGEAFGNSHPEASMTVLGEPVSCCNRDPMSDVSPQLSDATRRDRQAARVWPPA
jgi:hypothetical protein